MTGALPRLAALLLLAGAGCTGCTSTVAGQASPAAGATGTPLPQTATALEALLVTEVPSGLPRGPDGELAPPAGEKTIDDVAGYAEDAADQRSVLEDYGYRHGWERFWRSDEALTSVFVDQFAGPSGAAAYADDLVRNDAEYYGGVPQRSPDGLPEGCALMTVEEPDPHLGLSGPAAFAWCPHGVFSVSVAAAAGTADAARVEALAVTLEQLGRLPRG